MGYGVRRRWFASWPFICICVYMCACWLWPLNTEHQRERARWIKIVNKTNIPLWHTLTLKPFLIPGCGKSLLHATVTARRACLLFCPYDIQMLTVCSVEHCLFSSLQRYILQKVRCLQLSEIVKIANLRAHNMPQREPVDLLFSVKIFAHATKKKKPVFNSSSKIHYRLHIGYVWLSPL